MMLRDLKFHHLGLALRKDKDALIMLESLGYEIGEKILDPMQNVHVRLCKAQHHPDIEIVQSGEGKSPIDQIISKYNELIYHTCYETDDLGRTLAAIEKQGLRCLCLSERKQAVLFHGRHVSFYKIFGWGIIELLEKD
ncbi:MAG: VOC family protein [Alphaproteobacteria bacterium]|nr:VOC family protein [Alphaproteobacteria bacterium]MCK5518999.1 VOC family protein [Alphaproteobacteria bacterium]MCK5659069.1 VOC family protein [Alphaproteobacteria bacterium]